MCQCFIAFHPQIHGQLEALNKSVKGYLRCSSGSMPTKRVDYFSYAQYWYNTKFHVTIEITRSNYVPTIKDVFRLQLEKLSLDE